MANPEWDNYDPQRIVIREALLRILQEGNDAGWSYDQAADRLLAFFAPSEPLAGTRETTLRRLLWLCHGHEMLYGDDGEMQCNQCPLDFKRASVEDIERTFFTASLHRAASAPPETDGGGPCVHCGHRKGVHAMDGLKCPQTITPGHPIHWTSYEAARPSPGARTEEKSDG